jgi:hypothetical protein
MPRADQLLDDVPSKEVDTLPNSVRPARQHDGAVGAGVFGPAIEWLLKDDANFANVGPNEHDEKESEKNPRDLRESELFRLRRALLVAH